jgi:hypothetical protein
VLKFEAFCYNALKLSVEAFCFNVLKLCVEAPSSLFWCVEALRSLVNLCVEVLR